MYKNPIMRKKMGCDFNLPCGDVFQEIQENSEIVETIASELNGGDWITTITQGVLGCLGSWALGNPGSICTWTVECQSNCSK